jgi:hypothetical protein
MLRRWRGRLSGRHEWRKRESDKGEHYSECARCGRVRWFAGDDRGYDVLDSPGDLGFSVRDAERSRRDKN